MNAAPTTWSYSALAQWEECPAKYRYAKIDKLPDPAGPAMLRGRKIHKMCEDYSLEPHKYNITLEMSKFTPFFEALVQMPGRLTEQKWAFNSHWGPAKWSSDNTTWLRSIIDAGVIYEDNVVEVIDYKTGKIYGDNSEQVELFALTAMTHYPEAPYVITRLMYLDSGDEIIAEHAASDREALKRKWATKANKLFADNTYAAKPSEKACRFCNFSRSKGGPCRFG